MNIRELEAQAKALAPVFSRLLDKAVAKMQSELDKRDARIAELESIEPLQIDYESIAKTAAELIPLPKDGADGKDGQNGKDGLPGADGKDGRDGQDGQKGADGANGIDGKSVSEDAVKDAIAASFERRFSDMQLSWERQARDAFEKAIDRMPKPKDGADALPIEDIEITQDGRNVTLKLGKVERTIKLDTVIDRGVWRDGEYEKGDAVSYGGSLWIAQKDLPENVPGASKDHWRLAVKKGRDGKDLRDNSSARNDGDTVKL